MEAVSVSSHFVLSFYFISLAVRVILLRLATSRLVLYGTAIAIYVKSVLPSMFVSLGPLVVVTHCGYRHIHQLYRAPA